MSFSDRAVPSITLGDHDISLETGPYIIAEIGVNHAGDRDLAEQMVRDASAAGAHGVKFQSYKAGKLASKHSPAYWDLNSEPTASQYALFSKFDSFEERDYRYLAEVARECKVDFLSTPFDKESAAYLEPLMPFYKIASADLTNVPLLRQVAGIGKPIVLSTGASTLGETDMAVAILREAGCREISLLHCVLNYPTPNERAHLDMIGSLRRAFPDLVIGYSDHTLPDDAMTSLTTAYLLGARVIEKHFTYDKTLPGNDHYHAMDKHDLAVFVEQIAAIRELQGGQYHKQPLETEAISRKNARRSIVMDVEAVAGTILTEEMLTYKRPGHGISPIHWDEVIGRVLGRDVESDHILQWEDLVPVTSSGAGT